MSEKRNPTKYLKDFFNEFNKISVKNSSGHQRTFLEAWKNYLDTTEDFVVFMQIPKIGKLIEEIKYLLTEKLPEEENKVFLSWLNSISTFFCANQFNNPWANVKGTIPGYISHLNHISPAIKFLIDEDVIASDNLNNWDKKLEEIYQDIITSEEDSSIKETITKQILNIRESINLYRFNGKGGLEKAINESLGSIMTLETMNTSKSKARKKFNNLVGCLAITVGLLNNSVELGSHIIDTFFDKPQLLEYKNEFNIDDSEFKIVNEDTIADTINET